MSSRLLSNLHTSGEGDVNQVYDRMSILYRTCEMSALKISFVFLKKINDMFCQT